VIPFLRVQHLFDDFIDPLGLNQAGAGNPEGRSRSVLPYKTLAS
jgi:hypothetical protein